MDKIFRPAAIDELKKITGIFKAAIDDMRSRGIFQWDEIYPTEEDLRQDIQKGGMRLLVCGGEIISAVAIDEEQLDEYKDVRWKYGGEKVAVVHRLCVNPAFQGKGWGRQTMMYAERLMKSMGYTAVRLDAFSQNPFALKLYEGLSYERAGECVSGTVYSFYMKSRSDYTRRFL